jgi:outer membrane lipoprotein-sorting protein
LLASALVLASCAKKDLSVDDIIEKHAQALGGVDKINALSAIEMDAEITLMGMNAPIKMWMQKPDKIKLQVELMGNVSVQCLIGASGWMLTGGSVMDLPPENVKAMKENMDMQYQFLNNPLLNYKKNNIKVSLMGKDSSQGKSSYKLLVIKNSKDTTYTYIDANSFLVNRDQSSTLAPSGERLVIDIYYTDYRDESGVKMPHSIDIKVAGNQATSMKIKSVKAPKSIDPSVFAKPAGVPSAPLPNPNAASQAE